VFLNIILEAPASPDLKSFFLFTVLPMAAIGYFLILRPMQRQKKDREVMLNSLQNGVTVLTTGGIVGTIVSIAEDGTLVLRVKPDNIKLQVARSAIANLVTAEGKK